MTLDAHVIRSYDRFDLDVALTVAPGETVAVLGPSGAGKSTLLRCLVGLTPLDAGHIRVDDITLDAPAEHDCFVAPEHRPVGLVFQDHLLFPHLDARDNVAFGLRTAGTGRRLARVQATEWLTRVGMAEHSDRRPAQLSGGQAQRIALARALAPMLRLLLDEPLAALDVGTRGDVRRELRRHLDSFDGMRVLVTHDPIDAHALADRVVVVEGGRAVQTGTLAEVTARPRSRHVGDLVGVNLLAGSATGGIITLSSGAHLVAGEAVEGPVLAVVAPHSIALYRRPPDGSPRNVWPATVTDLDHRADRVRVQLGGVIPLVAEITTGALDALGLAPGDEIWATVKATDVTVSPA